MQFSIMEFYLEPGVSIVVPSKFKGRCTTIMNQVLLKTAIVHVKPDWVNTLNIIPSKQKKDFLLGKPTILRKAKNNYYTAFFPSKEVEKISGNNVSVVYIRYLIEAISLIYFTEIKLELEKRIKEVLLSRLMLQAKKTPVLKNDPMNDIL